MYFFEELGRDFWDTLYAITAVRVESEENRRIVEQPRADVSSTVCNMESLQANNLQIWPLSLVKLKPT